ncbi:flagellar hook-associated protein FlgK [Chromobacterium sp. Panama]|uniref:flagellar hook-associated protein FlgK n=1 Tax=Chromobacterium sp. Panama TaxID=2161826 RepID=UPI000D30C5E3|nr:flagellar hook-associated protein FlgK [Chromobacterium sp. Panama]PTU65513.1 flagellar hook-associated protein FlgK [Chromobacterium sp. Panama]
MSSNIFSIGVSGLNAAQTALSVTGNNIANVSTPGYNVQYITQAGRTPQYQGFGFLGQGVDVTNVLRTYDKFLSGQVQTAQTNSSYYSTQVKQLNQINNLMASTDVSILPALQDFFGAMQTLSQQPDAIPSRQTVLNMAQALSTKFATVDGQLQQLQSGANGQIKSTVDSINSLASQIASLNTEIAALTGGNQLSAQPNTLMDQRDQAMLELNKLVSAKAVPQADGTYSVYVGNGQTLVTGGQTNTLATQPLPSDPTTLQLVFNNPNGTVTAIPNNLMSGGQLGGLLNFRDGPLLQARQQLGTMAINFSASINYQNQLGVDNTGAAGLPIFNDLSSYASNPQNAASNLQVLMGDPNKLATASNMVSTGGAGGNGVTMSGVWATLPGGYAGSINSVPPVFPGTGTHPSIGMTGMTITAAGTPATMTATIAGPNGGGPYNVVPVGGGASNSFKLQTTAVPPVDVGVSFQLSGAPINGQTFTVGPAPAGTKPPPGDNTNLRELLAQQNLKLMGNQSYGSYYSTLVASVGNQTNTAQLQSAAMQNTLKQTTESLSNVSGVSLDQEAANLIKYQQSYQACSKVIQVAQTTFSSILNLMG